MAPPCLNRPPCSCTHPAALPLPPSIAGPSRFDEVCTVERMLRGVGECVVHLGGGSPDRGGEFEQGSVEVLEAAEGGGGHGEAAPAARGPVEDGPDQAGAGALAGEAVDDLGLTAGLAEGPLDEVAARSRARWMSAASSIDGLPDSVEACVPNSRAKAAPAQSRSADLTLGRQLRVVMAFTALERNRPESAVEAPVAAEGASAIGGSPRPGQLAASSSCWNALLTRSAFWMSVIVASGAARR